MHEESPKSFDGFRCLSGLGTADSEALVVYLTALTSSIKLHGSMLNSATVEGLQKT